MLVKEPIQEITQPNCSGRNQATLKAAMPPEERPQTQRFAGSSLILKRLYLGQQLLAQERGVGVTDCVVLERPLLGVLIGLTGR